MDSSDLSTKEIATDSYQQTAAGQEPASFFAWFSLALTIAPFLLLFVTGGVTGAEEQVFYGSSSNLEVVVGSYEIVNETIVYESPRKDSRQLAKLDRGTTVHVVGVLGDWLEIQSKQGRAPGFIRRVSIIGPRGLRMVIMQPTIVYSEPSQSSAEVAYIEPRTRVEIVNVQSNWLEIRSKHGRPSGFIRKDTLIVEEKQTEPDTMARQDGSSEQLPVNRSLETGSEDSVPAHTLEPDLQQPRRYQEILIPIGRDEVTQTSYSIAWRKSFEESSLCFGWVSKTVVGEVPKNVDLGEHAVAQRLLFEADKLIRRYCRNSKLYTTTSTIVKLYWTGDLRSYQPRESRKDNIVVSGWISYLNKNSHPEIAVGTYINHAYWEKQKRLQELETARLQAEQQRRLAEAQAQQEALLRAEKSRREKNQEGGNMLVPIGLLVLLLLLLGLRKGRNQESYSGTSDTSSDSASKTEKGEWPWKDKEVLIGQKNVYEKGTFSNTKVGTVQEHSWSPGKTIYKEGFLSSEKVGKVETTFWGTPKSIVGKDGNKVGDVKTTWMGRQIIVDEAGNEVGEYKDD